MGPPGKRGRDALRWMPLLLGLALIVAVVVVAIHRSEAQEFADLIRRAAPAWLLVAALFQLGTYVMVAESWRVLLRMRHVPRLGIELLKLSVGRLFVDQALPSASVSGAVFMAHGLEQLGIAPGTAMAAVVVELVAYYIGYSLGIIAAIVLMFAGRNVHAPILLALMIVLAMTSLFVVVLERMAQGKKMRLPHFVSRIPGVTAMMRALARADHVLLNDRGRLLRATPWEFGVHVLDALTVWALLLAVGVAMPPWTVFSSFMLASLARTVGIVPGGLGTFEAVSVTTLRAAGVPLAAALAATLLFRGFSFWLPMLPGWWLTRAGARGGGKQERS